MRGAAAGALEPHGNALSRAYRVAADTAQSAGAVLVLKHRSGPWWLQTDLLLVEPRTAAALQRGVRFTQPVGTLLSSIVTRYDRVPPEVRHEFPDGLSIREEPMQPNLPVEEKEKP